MEVQVSLLGVVLAMVSSMVVGAVWYAKPVFGARWMKLDGLSDKDVASGGAKAMGMTVVVSLITAYVLAYFSFVLADFYGISFMSAALKTAFMAWIGFTAARMITHDAFEQRNPKLTTMNIAHELVTLLVMAAVLGLVGV